MSNRPERTHRNRAAAFACAALLVILGACGDLVAPAAQQEPTAVPGSSPEMSRSRGRTSHLHGNGERYRNRGRGHGYGQVGDVEVQGMSVLGADRITRLTLSTGTLDPLAAGSGNITRVQVKAYDPGGNKLYTSNFNHLNPAGIQRLSLNGLTAGALLYIRVHVRGARIHKTNCGCRDDDRGRDRDDDRGRGRDDDHDQGRGGRDRDDDNDRHRGHGDRDWDHRGDDDHEDCNDDPRTDVVTLVDTVKAAPALDVDLNLPPKPVVGAPTVINATIAEINGDIGTRADCGLYVDGVAVDRATGIWVDAGDAVTCAFTYTFTDTRPHTVEVRATGNGLRGAGDTGTLAAVSPLQTGWGLAVEDRSSASTTVLDYTWSKPDGSHKEYSNTETTTNRSQSMTLQGSVTRAMAFPLATVDLVMESGGVEWQVERWSGLASALDGAGRACVSQQVPEQGAMFFLCNGLLGGATFGYTRFAGTVTYHSVGFSNVFDGPTATPNNYAWNDGYEMYREGGQVRPLGNAVTVRVQVTDALGSFGVVATAALSPFAEPGTVTPRTCITETPYWLDGGAQIICNSANTRESGRRGGGNG